MKQLLVGALALVLLAALAVFAAHRWSPATVATATADSNRSASATSSAEGPQRAPSEERRSTGPSPTQAPARSAVEPREILAHCERAEDHGAVSEGALFALDVGGEDGAQRAKLGARLAEIDAAGALQSSTRDATWRPCMLVAPGRSPTVFAWPMRLASTCAARIALERSASLVVHVRNPWRTAHLGVQVAVDFDIAERLAPESAERSVGRANFERRIESSPRGARFDELPAHAALSVLVDGGENRVFRSPNSLVLEPGESREIELDVLGGARVRVRVVDQDGRPVANQRLGTLASAPEVGADDELALIPSNGTPQFEIESRTDEHGECHFANLGPGRRWIALAPTRAPWDELDLRAVAPVAVRLDIAEPDVEPDREREIELHTERGVYLRGRVVVDDGALFSSDAANAEPTAVLILRAQMRGGGTTAQPIRDGTFAAGPLLDEPYSIEVSSARYAPIEPLRARPSDGPIEIRLQRGGRIEGQVVDPASDLGVRCEVALTAIASSQPVSIGSTDDSGRFAFAGCAPGEYRVCASTADARYALSTEVQLRGRQAEARLELAPLASTGRVRLALETAEDSAFELWSGDACCATAFLRGPFSREFGVPLGRCEVRRKRGGQVVERRGVTVVQGEVLEVRFAR